MRGYFHVLSALLCACILWGEVGCSPNAPREQARVVQAFEAWRNAVINKQTDQAMTYIPHHVDDYLVTLNAPSVAAPAPNATPSQ